MKYKLTIENDPNGFSPWYAKIWNEEGYSLECGGGNTPEEAEERVLEKFKEAKDRLPTITKEIEI